MFGPSKKELQNEINRLNIRVNHLRTEKIHLEDQIDKLADYLGVTIRWNQGYWVEEKPDE